MASNQRWGFSGTGQGYQLSNHIFLVNLYQQDLKEKGHKKKKKNLMKLKVETNLI